MTTQYTSILKLALPVQGELSGTWGDVVNDNITSMVEEAVAGRAVINTWTTNSHTLTTADGTTSEARCAMLEFTDTGAALTGAATVVCPSASKLYVCKNDSGQQVTIQTAAGTGVAIPDGETMFVFCDGTNVEQCETNFNSLSYNGYTLNFGGAVTTAGAFTTSGAYALTLTTTGATDVTLPTTGTLATLDGTETLTNKTLTAPTISSPTLTGSISATDLTISGNTTIGDASSDTLTVNSTITSNLIFTDDTYDIGATGATRPRNLFLSGNATIGGTVTLSGGIDVTGALGVDGDFDVNTNKFTVASATGNTLVAGTLGVTGITTATGGLNVDTISEITAAGGVTIDGLTVKDGAILRTGDLLFDGTGDIILDGDGASIRFKDNAVEYAHHYVNSNNYYIRSVISDADMIFQGNDGGSTVTALTLDMSTEGNATFQSATTPRVSLRVTGSDQASMKFDTSNGLQFDNSSYNYPIKFDGSSFVFNEQSNDSDFRVESDSNTHMLFVNAGSNVVGINSTLDAFNTDTSLQVAGRVRIGLGINSESSGMTTPTEPVMVLTKENNNPSSGFDRVYALAAQNSGYAVSGNTPPMSILLGGWQNGSSRSGGIEFDPSDQGLYVLAGGSQAGYSSTNRIAKFTPSAIVFNEDGEDVNFRVEGDDNQYALFVDAGNDRVAVGTNDTTSVNFTVADSMRVQSYGGNDAFINLAVGATAASPDQLYTIRIDNDASDSFEIDDNTDGSEFFRYTPSVGIILNEESKSDNDFRVESDSNSNMFVVDAGLNQVGVGAAPDGSAALDAVGRTLRAANIYTKYAQYSVPTATYVDVYWNDDTITLDTGYIYRFQLATLSTGTNTGVIYWVWFDDSVWHVDIESRHGTSSNNPQGRVDSSKFQIFTNHGSTYTVGVHSEARAAGTDDNTRSSIGLPGFITAYANDALVFNEEGDDLDFRVESDSKTHMLFVNAGADRVGINQSSPDHTLSVGGTTQILAGENNTGPIANGVTADVITSVPRGFSYVNVSYSSTATGGLLLLLYTTTASTTIVSTVSDQSGSAFSASVSGRALRATNTSGSTATLYASCMTLAWGTGD